VCVCVCVCVCVAMITAARNEKLKSSRELKLLVRYNGWECIVSEFRKLPMWYWSDINGRKRKFNSVPPKGTITSRYSSILFRAVMRIHRTGGAGAWL